MKKFISVSVVVALSLLLVLGFIGCKAKPEVPQEIRVGIPASMTGHYAAFGEGGIWGAKAVIEDINKQGGIYLKEYDKKLPIRLIVANTESDAIKAGTLAEDLVLRDKIHVFGAILEPPPTILPMIGVAERLKVPGITGGGPIEVYKFVESTGEPWEYIWVATFAIAESAPPGDFREGNPGYTMMGTWLGMLESYMIQTNKKAAVFATDDPDGRGWYEGFVPEAQKIGLEVYGAESNFGLFPPGTTDFSSLINKWKDNGCEFLWGSAPGPEAGTLLRQARVMGFEPKMSFVTRGTNFFEDVAAWGSDLAHGVTMEYFWHPSIKESAGVGGTTPQSLFERWQTDTGRPLNQGIGWGYAYNQALFNAIERAGSLDPDKISQAIGETDMTTMYHRVKFGTDRYHRPPIAIGQWVETDAPWIWEAPITFSYHDFLSPTAEHLFPIPYK